MVKNVAIDKNMLPLLCCLILLSHDIQIQFIYPSVKLQTFHYHYADKNGSEEQLASLVQLSKQDNIYSSACAHQKAFEWL